MKILSQRDPRWAGVKIGRSNETVGRKGCLITDNSAITDYIGNFKDPGVLAQLLDFTAAGLLLWQSIEKAGLDFVYRFYSRDDAKILKAFADPDQFVVLEVNHNHWLWLIGVVGGYKVMDPYYGDVIRITQRNYKITGFAILEKQDPDEWTTGDAPNDEKPIVAGDSPSFASLPFGSRFVDLSHWNEVVDLSKTKAAGYRGAIHKCSQGTDNKDSAYIENKKKIRDIDWAFGAYHYAEAKDPMNESEWFLKNIGEIGNGDELMLDYETYARPDADDWCLAWLNHVTGITGKKPILYTYHGMLIKYGFKKVAAAGYKLLAARYGLQEQRPNKRYQPNTGAFGKMWAWQFCSQGSVPGINKRVDLNVVMNNN